MTHLTLDRYILSLEPENMPGQLNTILPKAKAFVSWGGYCVFSVPGYEGFSKIHDLAIRYLHAIDWVETKGNLEQRLVCHQAFQKVKQLYKKGNDYLNQTLVYRHIIPQIGQDPYEQFHNLIKLNEKRIFGFPKETFQTIWGNDVEPSEKYTNCQNQEKWVATLDLISSELLHRTKPLPNPPS
jgi:hypothetical protein